MTSVKSIIILSLTFVFLFTSAIIVFSSECFFKPCFIDAKVNIIAKIRNLRHKQCSDVCISKTCVLDASELISALDLNRDPCDDFYEFVCGKYPVDVFDSFDSYRPSTKFFQNQYFMLNKLRRIIGNAPNEDPESVSFKRKVIYESCLNSNNPSVELRSMHQWLSDNAIPQWPLVDSRSTTSNLISWMVNLLSVQGLRLMDFMIMKMDTSQHRDERSNDNTTLNKIRIIISFKPVSLQDDCDKLEPSECKQLIQSMLEYTDIPSSAIRIILEDTLSVISEIQGIEKMSKKVRSGGSPIMNCNGEEKTIWCSVLFKYFSKENIDIDWSQANVMVMGKGFANALEQYLKKSEKRVIANYLAVRFLLMNVRLMTDIRRYPKAFETSRTPGLPATIDPSLLCIYPIMLYIPETLVTEFAEETKIEILMEYLLSVLRNMTLHIRSLVAKYSDSEAKQTLTNLQEYEITTSSYIKYVKSINMNNLFQSLNPHKNMFAKNIIELKRVAQRYNMESSNKWGMEALQHIMGRYFLMFAESSTGKITLGFSNFVNNLISPEHLMYVTVPVIGETLMHEIGHLIANSHVQECLTDIYKNLTIPGLSSMVDEFDRSEETRADLFGSKYAFLFYKHYVLQHGKEPILPGLPFSNQELYFLKYGQTFCEFGDAAQYKHYLTDTHSPLKHRININLRHNTEFGKVFGCKPNSYMRLADKCEFPY